MHQPPTINLFNHATSELSQDAFFAWLCAHADDRYKDHELHQLARAFIEWLSEDAKWTSLKYRQVEVIRQHLKIDLLIRLYTGGMDPGTDCYLLIEDKTFTSDHETQVLGYKKKLEECGWDGNTISPDRVYPVYIKTWVEDRVKTASGFKRILLPDLVDFFEANLKGIGSSIVRDWVEVRKHDIKELRSYSTKPMADWKDSQWIMCFYELQGKLQAELPIEREPHSSWVPNPKGGFVALTVGWPETADRTHYAYLQVSGASGSEPFMSFRIAPCDFHLRTTQESLREFWERAESCADWPGGVHRPKRLQPGESSCFAILHPNGDFGSWTEDGMFDMDKATAHIQRALECLDRIIPSVGTHPSPVR